MPDIKSLEKPVEAKIYKPDGDERILQTYVDTRMQQMQDFRRSLHVEKEWKEADEEYIPHELNFGTTRKRFETDQDTGIRSRMVPIGDSTEQWRSNASAPTLLAKIQTAMGIIIENNPEAMLTAMERKYEKTTDLAYALWKRNWEITDSKQTARMFAFNAMKYGWGVGRTFPRLIKYSKQILQEVDTENPENNKYEEKEMVWFNDVARQNLNPYTTWIDEQTKPYQPYSMNDCYYEMDYSYDSAKIEFEQYPNWKYVPRDCKVVHDIDKETNKDENNEQQKIRQDIVTIGFYENRLKDLFVIYVPKEKIILYNSPLPNDDGLLSLWHAPWLIRSADNPYGISIWKIIKQDKELYDKMNNMTMDQLVLSIMKWGYHTGTSGLIGDGKVNIVPGRSVQMTNGDFKWMEIPGPGQDSYSGLKILQTNMDDASGISPTLEGQLTGKTLGEIQLAREAALKRMKIPLENIAYAIEQDAYLTLSWMSQIYSTPEVKDFADESEMMAYEQDSEAQRDQLFQKVNPETGQVEGLQASYLPQLALHLEGRDGSLFESKKSQFFQVGTDIQPADTKWRGIFKVVPRSLLGTSEVVMKQIKQEMFNLITPLLSQPPQLVMKPIEQLLKINEEDPKDWLPESWINPQPAALPGQMGPASPEQPLFTPMGGAPQSVVPQSQVTTPPQAQAGGLKSLMSSLFRR